MSSSTTLPTDVERYMALHIPHYMHEGIRSYVLEHRRPGDFLAAVFADDLLRAVQSADATNRYCLVDYIELRLMLPTECQGSWERVALWCKKGK